MKKWIIEDMGPRGGQTIIEADTLSEAWGKCAALDNEGRPPNNSDWRVIGLMDASDEEQEGKAS